MYKKTLFTIFTIIILFQKISVAQIIVGEIPDKFIALNLTRTSQTFQKQGFSIIFNLPGFMSMSLSEINLMYKDKDYDSYFIGFGALYGLIGFNKKLLKFQNSYLYGNMSIGVFRSWYNLGSLGISYLFEEKKINTSFEISIDAFFHHGQGSGDLIPGKLSNYHMRGVIGNIVFSKKIFPNIILCLNTGLSYTEYQYVEYNLTNNNGSYYHYVTKGKADIGNYIGNPKWKGNWLIPWGITISYSF